MKFLSIDSSLANTGIALGDVDPQGNIAIPMIDLTVTKKSTSRQVRASSDTIARGRQTHKFISDYITNHNPALIFVETPSGSQNSSAMKSYGMTCQLIAGLFPPPIEVTPTEVKLASVGSKTASKSDMIEWAMNLYPNLPWFLHNDGTPVAKNEHMADAIAIAHAAILTPEYLRIPHI